MKTITIKIPEDESKDLEAFIKKKITLLNQNLLGI